MTWMSYTSLANIIPTQCFKVAWEVVGSIPQVMGSGNFPGIEVDKKKKIVKITFYILEYTLISIWKLLCTVCTEVQKKLSVQRWTHRTLNETHIVPKVTGMTQSKCLLKILGRTCWSTSQPTVNSWGSGWPILICFQNVLLFTPLWPYLLTLPAIMLSK